MSISSRSRRDLPTPAWPMHGHQVGPLLALDPLDQRDEQLGLLGAPDQLRLAAARAPRPGTAITSFASQAGTGSSLPFRISGSRRS